LLIQTAPTSEDDSPQTPSEPATPAEPQIPNGAISWTEAGRHIGETVTIYGTVVGTTYASSSNGKPTFINIGAAYPDGSGVSIVIWKDYRSRFSSAPEVLYSGKTICVTGEIYLYRDACSIEVQSPSQIKVIE
jgi:DNA/RNA endonuclease YhcR with UshA esterase domain